MMHNKLFVGNLSRRLSQEDLQSLFGAYGTVVSCLIPTIKGTGRRCGFGYVEMSTRQEAEAAIKGLHNRPFDGQNLSVSVSRPSLSEGRCKQRHFDEKQNFTIHDLESLHPSFYPTMFFPTNWQGTLTDILNFGQCPAHNRVEVVLKLMSQPSLICFAEWCANEAKKHAAAIGDDQGDAWYHAEEAIDAVNSAAAIGASVLDEGAQNGHDYSAADYVMLAAIAAGAAAGAAFGADADEAESEKQIVKLIESLSKEHSFGGSD